MSKRFKMSKKSSKKSFTKNAKRVHTKNVTTNPVRGGIRA